MGHPVYVEHISWGWALSQTKEGLGPIFNLKLRKIVGAGFDQKLIFGLISRNGG